MHIYRNGFKFKDIYLQKWRLMNYSKSNKQVSATESRAINLSTVAMIAAAGNRVYVISC